MDKKIDLLMISKNCAINGISTVIMNYCTLLDKNKYNIYIFAGEPVDDSNIKKCKDEKINFIKAPNKDTQKKDYYKYLYQTLKQKHFDIVHVHGNSSAMAVDLLLAQIHGVKIRIAHSHNSSQIKQSIMHKLINPFFKYTYTNAFACSELAGKWLFKNNFEIIPNGFKLDNFKYSADTRKKIRKKLNIKDEFLIGHIGVFNDQKNQEYIVKVFNELSKNHKNFKLILIGHGAKQQNIEKIISNSPYKDRIILYGKATNPAELYHAMDLFVLPSRYEGLGIVLLEAQINGLHCIASKHVPQEANITGNVSFIDINEINIKDWKRKILEISKIKNNRQIEEDRERIQYYNIEHNAKALNEKYINFITNRKAKR